MKKSLLACVFTALTLSGIANAGWYPATAIAIAGIEMNKTFGDCTIGSGEGLALVGFAGEGYSYVFTLNQDPYSKALLSTLLSAQAQGVKVQVEWTAGVCGGARIMTGVKVFP